MSKSNDFSAAISHQELAAGGFIGVAVLTWTSADGARHQRIASFDKATFTTQAAAEHHARLQLCAGLIDGTLRDHASVRDAS